MPRQAIAFHSRHARLWWRFHGFSGPTLVCSNNQLCYFADGTSFTV
jgi:hypothetical protein